MESVELQIISRCQKGELNFFGELYDKYVRKIYDFIYYRTSHKETAEDLTSKTFFKALKNINKYSCRKGSFSSWLYQIARNTVIDHYRTQKKDSNIDDFWNLSVKQDLNRDIDAAQKLDEVKKYLEKIKPHQKEVVMMRLWDDMPYEEVAEIVGLSAANCKMIFSRVMSKVREDMVYMGIALLIFIKEIL